jgi:signal transduction histidine kinase
LESVQAEIEISPEHEEDMQIAMNQIKRIEATINRFLNFAKPQEPVFSTIEVPRFIEDTLLVVKPKANQQQTYVSVLLANELPKIKGDKKQLGEVLLNLMVNALEAMTSRGKLTVFAIADRCEINGEQRDCVRIDVSDTGPGIDEENISRLFDPFFTTKASGTGLGLSIVSSTVRAHGGKVKVESTIGEGTTFSIFLPTVEQVAEKNGKDTDN